MNTQTYLASRWADQIALSHEIAEAPRVNLMRDLGYCQVFPGNCAVESDGVIREFRNPAELYAFVLREFW